MEDEKLVLIIVVSVLVILVVVLFSVPFFATQGGDRTFPPKPPIPGFQRSPAIEQLAP